MMFSRDLKSENVLVWKLPPPFSKQEVKIGDVHVKLADYGISRPTLPTGAKGFGGTEGFMAPEIIKYNGEEVPNLFVFCPPPHTQVSKRCVEARKVAQKALR